MICQSPKRLQSSPERSWQGLLLVAVVSGTLAACGEFQSVLPEAGAAGASTSKLGLAAADAKVDAAGRSDRAMKTDYSSPKDAKAIIGEARRLAKSGRKEEALALLDRILTGEGGKDKRLRIEHGLLALELGQLDTAKASLQLANDPLAPNWRVLSALGVVAASQGRQGDAQRFLTKALDLAPNNTTVMNNLALSYILDKKAEQAEALLRQATKSSMGQPRVQQNLALSLGLSGKQKEAVKEGTTALGPDAAKGNVEYLTGLRQDRDGGLRVSEAAK